MARELKEAGETVSANFAKAAGSGVSNGHLDVAGRATARSYLRYPIEVRFGIECVEIIRKICRHASE